MNIIHEIHKFMFLFGRKMDKLITDNMDLTFPQFMILNIVGDNKSCQQKNIADFRKLTKSAISKQMGVLVKAGLVKITTNSKNKREDVIVLTEKGKETLKKAKKIFKKENDRIFNNLNKAEIDNLQVVLFKITKYVKN